MSGIYIHIPFCQRRCAYCDFFSSTDSGQQETYVTALCRELEMRKSYIAAPSPVRTIYLGGGTPSQLTLPQLERLFLYIYKVYDIAPDAEVTLEANPDDLTEAYVSGLKAMLPVNRISMGVQTFDDQLLRLLGRRHTARQAIEAVSRCRTHGFHNLSIDLIYGLPGQELTAWEWELEQAVALRVPHLSAYHLTYEEGTPLWRMRQQGIVSEVDEEVSAAMYTLLVGKLTAAGYQHYEISNFCLPDMHSRHNSSYWQGIPYLGCGAAAHSYDGHSRQWNIASIPQYIQGISEGTPLIEREELDLHTRYNDYLVTTLRTRWGASLNHVNTEFGKELHTYLQRMARPHLQRGHLEIQGDTLRLTEAGIFLSDGIISDLLWVEE
ncbi:MAG: radical SAM family heme chaperone HemW [Bacteroidaceae bacterium]|nr:radical SAM family heme chaperone HemW [Bacteroidaceae bacterium]